MEEEFGNVRTGLQSRFLGDMEVEGGVKRKRGKKGGVLVCLFGGRGEKKGQKTRILVCNLDGNEPGLQSRANLGIEPRGGDYGLMDEEVTVDNGAQEREVGTRDGALQQT